MSILNRIQPFSLYLLIFEAIQSIICEPLFVINLIRLYSFFFLKVFSPHKSFFLYFLPLIGIRICQDEPTKKWRTTQRFSPYLQPRDSNRITDYMDIYKEKTSLNFWYMNGSICEIIKQFFCIIFIFSFIALAILWLSTAALYCSLIFSYHFHCSSQEKVWLKVYHGKRDLRLI